MIYIIYLIYVTIDVDSADAPFIVDIHAKNIN